MRLGYFRADPKGMNTRELQMLEAAQCDQILIDSAHGGRSKVLSSRLDDLKTGDSLVVVRLGHLMNMPGLLGLLADLVAREIEVQSLTDRLRTSDPGVSATLMLLSRYLIQSSAPSDRRRGRPPAMKPDDVERARQMIVEEKVPVAQVANALGVSRSTLYRHLPAA